MDQIVRDDTLIPWHVVELSSSLSQYLSRWAHDSGFSTYAEYSTLDGQDPKEANTATPRWDSDNRQLWVGSHLARTFKKHAKTQFEILATFEREGWSHLVEVSLDHSQIDDAVQGLKNGLREDAKRRGLEKPLIWFGKGGEEGFACWWRP
jgi:hypothetical protein